MASCREIITVQLGSSSNFVGTHWWNIQESSFIYDRKLAESDDTRLNHDVLFREGTNIFNKTTFTPRLMAVDFNDNIGRTNLSGNLYPEFTPKNDKDELGPGTSVMVTRPSKPPNQFLADLEAKEKRSSDDDESHPKRSAKVETKYYNLDDVVSTWTDFLKVPYHPKSLLSCEPLNPYGAMSRFQDGENMCKSGQLLDDFESRLRFFAEDCNCLQGFHILCDMHDGMTGLTAEFVQYIRDEYPRNALFAMPVFPSVLTLNESSDYAQYVWNAANGLVALGTTCTVVLPLSTANILWNKPNYQCQFPFLNYKAHLPYHTSALLATALETMTTSWRSLSSFDNLPDICDTMTFDGRKFVQLTSAYPLGTTLNNFVKREQDGRVSLTPYSSVQEHHANQFPRFLNISLRGMKDLLSHRVTSGEPGYRTECQNASDLLLKRYSDNSSSVRAGAIYDPVHTKAPYPNIFKDIVGKNGLFTDDQNVRLQNEAVVRIPALTILESTWQSKNFINALLESVNRLNWQKLKIERDQIDQIVNQLDDFSKPFSV